MNSRYDLEIEQWISVWVLEHWLKYSAGGIFLLSKKFEFLMLYSKPPSESELGFPSTGKGVVTHQFSRTMGAGISNASPPRSSGWEVKSFSPF